MKGISPLVAAVILIAATMSIAGILSFWATGFIQKKLTESENVTEETGCLGAEFKLHSGSYEVATNATNGTLFLRLDNRRAVDLLLENLYLFYPDKSMDTIPLNVMLKGNDIKQFTIENVTDGFTSGEIRTNCPEVILDFTYSQVT